MIKRYTNIPLLLLLIVISGVFYLINLGKLPLEDYDEATYATVLRESIQKGDYFSFTYFGNNWFEKPPLQFWLAAVSAKIFGFSELALRWPSALFGILAIVLVYLIVYESTKNKPASFVAALLLILMPFFLASTRNFRMDTPVTASILAALYFFIIASKKPVYFVVVGASIAIGVLLKSVIALLAIPIILIWSLTYKNWGWVKNRYFVYSTVVFLTVTAPWHIYESTKFGRAFWDNYLGYHVFQRATQNILNSKITVGYFVSSLWKTSEPFIPVFIAAAMLLLLLTIKFSYRSPTSLGLFKLALSALTAALFIFTIFSLVKTKLITYYTPMYPFAAVFIGSVFGLTLESTKLKWGRWFWGILMILIVINAGFSAIHEAFIKPQVYVSKPTEEEKDIGLTLRAKAKKDEEINLFNWNHHNTIRYYSGRPTESLQFNTGRKPQPPFWMVLPTEVLELNPELKKLPAPYAGKFLTLIHFMN